MFFCFVFLMWFMSVTSIKLNDSNIFSKCIFTLSLIMWFLFTYKWLFRLMIANYWQKGKKRFFFSSVEHSQQNIIATHKNDTWAKQEWSICMRKTLTQISKIQFILGKWPNINFSFQEQHSKSEKKKCLICTRFIQCEASNVNDCVYVYWNSNLFNFSVISMILACEFDTIIVSDARARYIKYKIHALRLFICYSKQHTSVSSKWHMFTNQHHQIFCHLHPFVWVAYSTHRIQNPILPSSDLRLNVTVNVWYICVYLQCWWSKTAFPEKK